MQLDAAALGRLLPYAAWVKDISLRYRWINRHWATLLDLSEQRIVGHNDAECFPPWLSVLMTRDDCAVLARAQAKQIEIMVQLQDGRQRMWRIQRQPLFDAEGNLDGLAGFVTDITDDWQVRCELKTISLRESNWWKALKSHALLATMNQNGHYTYVSEQLCQLVGRPATTLLGQGHATLGWIAEGVDFNYLLALAAQGKPASFEFSGTTGNGTRFWAHSLVISLGSSDGDNQRFVEVVSDQGEGRNVALKLAATNTQLTRTVNENVELIARLDHLTRTDTLTGLFNRRSFQERAAQERTRSTRLKQPIALLVLDIDHFRQINDQHGHAAGDQVLVQLAEICRSTCRAVDVLARIAGEKFALLLPDTNLSAAEVITERLRSTLAERAVPIPEQQPVQFTVSIGLTSWLAEETFSAALARADQALAQAKADGRNRVVSG